jgi:hypothetical protein
MPANNKYRFLNLPNGFYSSTALEQRFSAMEDFDTAQTGQWRVDGLKPDVYTDSLYDWLDEHNLESGAAEIFFLPANSYIGLHIDMDKNGLVPISDYTKIVFSWGGLEGHEWQYANAKNGIDPELGTNNCGSPHKRYKISEVDVTDTINVTQPLLANVGVIHRARNTGNTPVWLLCLILRDKTTHKRVDFADALTVLNDYIVN